MTSKDGSLLGLADYLEPNERDALIAGLTETWRISMRADPADLDHDLEACKRWFDPVAQGQRLRRQLAEMPQLPPDTYDPGPPLTLRIDADRCLVTPEGRCALELLLGLEPGASGYFVPESDFVAFDRKLARMYRRWGRHRLDSVLELLAGSNKPLQIPAAGVVIALLVNRCTAEERALTRFAKADARRVVDEAFFAPVQAFADVLAPSKRRDRNNPRLLGGWMLYEARRRLGDGLAVVDARAGQDGKVWIRPEREDDVVHRVAKDLARGHRARATPEKFSRAFDALVDSLRKRLPKLAGFGLVHERPRHTAGLRTKFLDSLVVHIKSE